MFYRKKVSGPEGALNTEADVGKCFEEILCNMEDIRIWRTKILASQRYGSPCLC